MKYIFSLLLLLGLLVFPMSVSASVYVHGYTKSNGTYVAPHYRSNPDGNFYNNWSTKGNINPYTGAAGTKTAPSTYYPSNSSFSPSYIPLPICTQSVVGNKGNWTFENNGCNQDIHLTWDKGTNDDFYSIALSKTPGTNPGPLFDTRETMYTFTNINPGKYYINIKAGQSCGWGNIYYWTINVPDVKPSASLTEEVISEEKRILNYTTKCAKKVEISPSLGKITNLNYGSFTIHPTQNISYELVAKNGTQQTSQTVLVKYPLQTKNMNAQIPTDVTKEGQETNLPSTPSIIWWNPLTWF